MREASLDLTTSSQIRRASDSPPPMAAAATAHAQRQLHRARTATGRSGEEEEAKPNKKKKSLAKILFPPNMSASEMVARGRLGKFVSPKKVSRMMMIATEQF